MTASAATLTEIKGNCDQTHLKPWNTTLDRYNFFSRTKQRHKSLRQFWIVLTGLAAKCDFGHQTESLTMAAFFQSINNRTVQKRLCTEPKDWPEKAVRFANAFGVAISQLKSSGEVKEIPVLAIERKTRNMCPRYQFEFSQNHLAECKNKNEKCRNYGVMERFARTWKKAKNYQPWGKCQIIK